MTTLPPALRLQPAQRRDLVITTRKLLEGIYCHLPQKKALYGSDPLIRMQRLLQSDDISDRGPIADRLFFSEFLAVLHGLRDLHTGMSYTDPKWRGRVAALPLLIERTGPPNKPCYLISKHTEKVDAKFEGVQVTHWNGIPIDTAVARLATRTRGANSAAALARAVEHLTIRPLDEFLQPDEDWVTLTLADRGDLRLSWSDLGSRELERTGLVSSSSATIDLGIDHTGRANQAAKQTLFTSTVPTSDSFVRAETKPIGGRRIGYLRVYSFVAPDVVAATKVLADALTGFETDGCDGLIVDIRNNPGGLIPLAENLLGLLTANPVITRFSFLATPLTKAMCANSSDLAGWSPSVESAASTGDAFSAALPITNQRSVPQPVTDLPAVLITDATTYSAGDIFAAGWIDNAIGSTVATATTTGAGGANVWNLSQITSRLPDDTGSEFQLPAGLDIRLSVRRALRAGPSDSLPIEDLGIKATFLHVIQPEDILGTNEALLLTAVQHLPRRRRRARVG